MRRLSLVLTLLILTLVLCSCGTVVDQDKLFQGQSKAMLTAKVMKVYEGSMLIGEVGEGANGYELYMVALDEQLVVGGEILAGAIIEVGYDGVVLETYPAKLGTVQYINLVEQQDDLVGFYAAMFNDLLTVDPGLNQDISVIAVDLSKAENLTEVEKGALTYVMGNQVGVETVKGTFDELCEQGYIDREKNVFTNGILLSLDVEEIKANQFTFHAQKWRSGLGAYFFHDCTAIKRDEGWTYTIGAEMIS